MSRVIISVPESPWIEIQDVPIPKQAWPERVWRHHRDNDVIAARLETSFLHSSSSGGKEGVRGGKGSRGT